MEISGKNLLVAFGNMITSIKINRLKKITNNEYRRITSSERPSYPIGYDISTKKLNFKTEIDIRGKRANEALQEVIDFIDEAIVVDVNEAKILHGKGDGILRQIIRDYLQTVDMIKSFKDEHIERGGSGITVVRFDSNKILP